jgi:hypothetical protein
MHDEETYKGKTLKPEIGCLNCSLRKECDVVCWRKDLAPIVLSYGVRSGLACLKLHTAHRPEDLCAVA